MVLFNVLGYVVVHSEVTASDEDSVARQQTQMSYLALLCDRATSWLSAMTEITADLPGKRA
eukprot:203363-Amphidinium_carterae.5